MVNASSTFHPIELMHAYLDFDYRATILADFQMPQWWSERRNYLFAIVLDGKGPAPGSRRHCHCRDDGWTSLPTTSLRRPPCRYPESTDRHFFAYLTLLQVPHPDNVPLARLRLPWRDRLHRARLLPCHPQAQGEEMVESMRWDIEIGLHMRESYREGR